MASEGSRMSTRLRSSTLVFTVFTVAGAAMIYQFSVVTALIFIMGDSIVLFSVFTGVFLCSMGVGALVGAKQTHTTHIAFIRAQFALAFLGLAALPLIFLLFAGSEYLRRTGVALPPALLTLCFWTTGLLIDVLFGAFTGTQLPMLAGLFRDLWLPERSLAFLLGFDYLGSFLGAVLFPLLLFPSVGLFRTVLVAAVLNAAMALLSNAVLGGKSKAYLWPATLLGLLLVVSFVFSPTLEHLLDTLVYGAP